MHVIWKGSISFGLVNIPVKLYHGSRDREMKFVMLHKKDLSQIRYARICKQEGTEIPWNDIVKGFEYAKGEFVVINQEDFEKANVKKTKTVEILSFTDEKDVDTIYYEKPYILEPDKGAAHTYALLCEALKKSKKVGIAKFVIHNREHVAVVKPYKNILLLIQLRYEDELVHSEGIEVPKLEKSNAKELDIAMQLIQHLTKSFEPKDFKDTYTNEIKQIIEKKAKGRRILPKGEEPVPTKVHDIMSLLKASLDQKPKKAKRRRTA